MPWFFFGLAFAFLNAMTMLINQKYRLDGRLISGMRGIGVAILYFPAIFFVSAPSSGVFWLLIILEGAISTFFNARLYASAAKYGAGSTSRMNVLAIAFGMVSWWIIDWRRFISLAEDPIVFVGIMAALALTGAGFLAMSKGGFKKGEISYMMPAVVVLAAMMINRKELMSHADLLSASVFYCEVSILFSGVANLGLYAHGNGSANLLRELSKSSVVKAGIIMAANDFNRKSRRFVCSQSCLC